jgi:pyruvate dehydrogenase E2 component (dihydrolipoamide acetyltransferase)
LGQTTDTVTLVTWYLGEGDDVVEGEPLFAIESDKATLDIEAQASGVLRHVSAVEGDDIQALTVIAWIEASGEDLDEAEARDEHKPSDPPQGGSFGSAAAEPSPPERLFVSPRARRLAELEGVPLSDLTGTGPEGAIVERDVRSWLDAQNRKTISPVAKKMAREAGLDWRQVQGTGPGGKVIKEDLRAAIKASREAESPALSPAAVEQPAGSRPFNEPTLERPLRGLRAVIAQRMAESTSSTARVTLVAEANASALVELRQELAADQFAVSYNDLLLYILGRALTEHPAVNASLEADVVRQWKRTHIGLAVDTERGLLVPVLRDVNEKRLGQLAQASKDLIERARTNQLRPQDLTGGTFTLTNLGMFGIDAFTPIIKMPETAILGVGRIKRRPVAAGDQVVVRPVVWMSLTFDHRVIDGAPAARFLQRVVGLIERPSLMHT